MANPKGRPKVKNKYAWIVTPDGVQAVPVRMHQGVYKTFNYDKEKQRTTFGKEIKSPIFDSLEEANKNAPKFIGYQEDMRGLQGKGDEMFYDAKYGYEINADNELAVVEYRYNPASGKRADGYRRYIYYDDGFQTPGRLAPGELFDTPDAAIDDYKTNYAGGKKIDFNAFDEAQADMAAREPSQAELDRYTKSLTQADDAQIEAYKDMTAGYTNENIAENIDKQTGTPGIGTKALDVVGKVFGPVDEIVMKSLSQGLPKLFAGTALAGVMGGAGAMLAKGLAAWSVGNLALGVVKGAGTFAAQYGGDTSKAIDAMLDGEIPEKTFKESVQESFGEGMEQFTNQMQYDPFYMAIDKTIEKATGGVVEGQDPISVVKGIQYLLGGK